MKSILVLVIAGGLLMLAAVTYDFLVPTAKTTQNKTLVDIGRGTTPRNLCRDLLDKGLTREPELCYGYGKLMGVWPKLQAGVYEFRADDSVYAILRKLERAESKLLALTVVEGENRFQIAEKIKLLDVKSATEFEKLTERAHAGATWWEQDLPEAFKTTQPSSLEGFLYPDTYHFAQKAPAQEVIRTMIKRFKIEWNSINFRAAKVQSLTPHQILVLASMIEKETGMDAQRTVISSVFHNRLQKKMRLQSDPTTIYGIWSRFVGPQKGNLRRADLQESTPYNTYTIAALPPGPICNPSRQSIDAALNPADTQFLYFVARKDGTTEFSESLKQHNEAVQRYQLSNGL